MFRLTSSTHRGMTNQGVINHAPTKGLRLLLGLFFSSAVSIAAYRRQSLNRSGVAGAIVAGTTTVGMGGWSWGLSLIFFFLSSSFFSHFRSREKARTAVDKFSKGSQRDAAQVAANGGVATLLALGYGVTPAHAETVRDVLRSAYIGALATATADTWATELGILSAEQPRLITTGKPVVRGTSGGVTFFGTGISALGAFALGSFFWLLEGYQRKFAMLPLIALVSGTLGSIADSTLGATFQAMYYCPTCQAETEQRVHHCGTKTTPLRGRPWFNNDVVNLLATLIGSLVGVVVHLVTIKLRKREHDACSLFRSFVGLNQLVGPIAKEGQAEVGVEGNQDNQTYP